MVGINKARLKRGTIAGAILALWTASLLAPGYTVEHTNVGRYGTIVARSTDFIQGAIVEKVLLNSPEYEGSPNTIQRHGRVIRYPHAEATILFAHGYMCDKKDIDFLRCLFPRGKYNIMTFDFRAHGENREGQYCTLGRDEALDVATAAKFLKNHPDLQGKPLYFYGFSMGAVSGIEAQAKEDLFKLMILDCPFASTPIIIQRGIDNLKFSIFGYSFYLPGRTILQRYAFHPYVQSLLKMMLKAVANMDSKDIATRVYPLEPIKTVAKLKVPLFFIYCKNDDKLSRSDMKELVGNATASPCVWYWLSNGSGHFKTFFCRRDTYETRVREFVDLYEKNKLLERGNVVFEDGDDDIIMD